MASEAVAAYATDQLAYVAELERAVERARREPSYEGDAVLAWLRARADGVERPKPDATVPPIELDDGAA